MKRVLSNYWRDLALSLAAIAIMLPTCWYRYGIDHAVYHYIGSGWLRGLLPFRDCFDVKPPGIYALYALGILLFGQTQAAIRILELVGVIGIAWVIGGVSRAPAIRQDGVSGVCAVLLASCYVTLFGFWDTGQAELWIGIFTVAAYAVLASGRSSAGRCVAAGVLASIAIFFKMTMVIPVAVLAGMAGARAAAEKDRRIRTFCRGAIWFLAGVLLPIAGTILYFFAHRGIYALYEWFLYVLRYTSVPLYSEWVRWMGPEWLLDRGGFWYGVFGALAAAGFFETRGTHNAGKYLVALILLAAAILSVVVQRLYLSYHSASLGPFLVLVASFGLRRLVANRPQVAFAGTLFIAAGGFLSSASWSGSGNPPINYRTYVWHAWLPRVTGQISDKDFDAVFVGPFEYNYVTHRELAELISQRKPRHGDQLQIRNFAPTAYVLTGLYSPSRFMSETPVRNKYYAQFCPTCVEEHERVLRERPPRFFITVTGDVQDIARLQARGYGLVGARGTYVLLELGYTEARLGVDEVKQLIGSARGIKGLIADKFPFDITLGRNGEMDFSIANLRQRAIYRVSEEGRLCMRWKQGYARYDSCFLIYRNPDGSYLFFEPSGLVVAEHMSVVR